MKRNRLIGLLIVLMIIPLDLFGQLKIGFIDSNVILQQSSEVRNAQAQVEKETLRLEAELNTMVERLDSLNMEYERQRLVLSNEKILEKEQEIQALWMAAQQYQDDKFGTDGEMYRLQAQLMSPILDRIDAAVKKIGAEQSYDFIMDAAGGALVYALDAHDLTNDVIVELRRTTTSSN